MKSAGKISVMLVGTVLICGAGAFSWLFVKARASARRIVQDANACRARAEHGDPNAQYELARMYYSGKGVPQDYKEAAEWYRKAADQGNAKAQYGIGFMYHEGKRVARDHTAALTWYRKAADQGNAKAEYDIGYSYYEGKDALQDYDEAARWFRKAADHDDARAQDGLGYMYSQGKGVPQSDSDAVALYRKAADQGFARAQADLGYMYSQGKGVPQDYAQAARWYRKAAKQGDQYARRALDSMNIRITAGRKIYLSAAFLGLMSLLINSKGKIGNQQQRGVTLGAVLGVLWVVLTVYGDSHVGLLYSMSAVNMFYFGRGLVSGVSVVMLLSFVWPQGIKIVLSACGILIIAVNVYATTHFHLRHVADCPRAFYSINALLMGAAITAFLLLLASRRAAGGQNGNAADSQLVTNH